MCTGWWDGDCVVVGFLGWGWFMVFWWWDLGEMLVIWGLRGKMV